jgi:hypothetical protein
VSELGNGRSSGRSRGQRLGKDPGAEAEPVRYSAGAPVWRSGVAAAARGSAPGGAMWRRRLGFRWGCRGKVDCGGGSGAHLKGEAGLGVRVQEADAARRSRRGLGRPLREVEGEFDERAILVSQREGARLRLSGEATLSCCLLG